MRLPFLATLSKKRLVKNDVSTPTLFHFEDASATLRDDMLCVTFVSFALR